ncbi:beta-ketoacyl synthase N-terminal-like domain-containing protein [Actinosynnema sp. CA-248983]
MEHVDVVGIGAVTGYGWGVETMWDGLLAGRTSAAPHTGLGGTFPDPCWFARVPHPPGPSASTRYGRAVAAVALEALADARAHGWQPGERVAVLHATTGADRERSRERYLGPGEASSRRRLAEQLWTTPLGQVMIDNSFFGPSAVLSAACSSSLHAVAMAHRLLACGDATDVVVTSADVGYDGEEIRLFAELGALVHDSPPEEVCRPFQEGTRGFVIGEAAAAVVLTASPQEAGYLRVLSTALGNDAYHPVFLEPSGRQVVATVDRALAGAGVDPSEISLYVAHAAGTSDSNAADETVLGHLGPKTVAYGLKSLLGHTLGTAPLLDLVALACASVEGVIPAPHPVSDRRHPQLAEGHFLNPGGFALQLGLGYGGNIAAAVVQPHIGGER